MIPEKKPDEKFTYADYLTWPEDERWELIEGEAYSMAPAPRRIHQSLVIKIILKIGRFLDGKPCELYAAPFDVRFSEFSDVSDNDINTVVQPDVLVVCDKSKLDDRGCKGAPDLIIEILSPSTAWRDETDKLKLYEKHGVKEYWTVNPETKCFMIYHLEQNRFSKPDYLREGDVLESRVLKGLEIDLSTVFTEK